VQEVAVVECLEAEILELQIALGLQRRGQTRQVEAAELRFEQFGLDALSHIDREIISIAACHLGLGRLLRSAMNGRERLAAQAIEKQASAGVGIVRLTLDQGAGSQDGSLGQFVFGDAVVEIAHRFGEDRLRRHIGQSLAGLAHDRGETSHVERNARAILEAHLEAGRGRDGLRDCLGPFRGPLLPIEHVSAGDLLVSGAHEGEFDLVLNIFDVEGPTRLGPACQGGDDLARQVFNDVVHTPGGSGRGALDAEEGLGERNGDLGGIEGRDCAVAADDLITRLGTTWAGGGRRYCYHRRSSGMVGVEGRRHSATPNCRGHGPRNAKRDREDARFTKRSNGAPRPRT